MAQTERTRIQSQARFWAMEEAEGYGVHTVKRWSTYMDGRQRDTHGAMNGQTVDSFSKFKSPSGAELMFPGDPDAPAEEVINCRCVMVPDVLKPDERISENPLDSRDNEQNGLINSKDSYIIESGARNHVHDADNWQGKHAKLYYEEVRNRKPGVDARKISEHTQFTEKAVEEIRQHMFINKYWLDGGTEYKRFDPDFEQAQAWQRLTEGKGTETDVLLLKHEYYELTQMRIHNYSCFPVAVARPHLYYKAKGVFCACSSLKLY